MAVLPLPKNALHKEELEYHGKFGHTLGNIQYIAIMIIIDHCYSTCCLDTQTVAPTLPGFQGIKHCVQYLASHPHKPITYPSRYYYGSNAFRFTWRGNKVEEHRTKNCLDCYQYVDHTRILNIRRSVSGVIHTLFGVAVWWKVQIQPALASDCTNRETFCMNKAVNKTKVIRRYMESLALNKGSSTVHW